MQVQGTDAHMAGTSETSPSLTPPTEEAILTEEVSYACITRRTFDLTAANDYPI